MEGGLLTIEDLKYTLLCFILFIIIFLIIKVYMIFNSIVVCEELDICYVDALWFV